MRWRLGIALAACIASLLGACAQVKPVPELAEKGALPPDFPEAYYRQAAAQGKPVFRVDSKTSVVVMEVRRSGSLARLGHDHVVASHDVKGYVVPADGRADLYVPLAQLVVDEPALRAEVGFQTQPSESDVAGTRSNMLNSVLEAERYPFALIRVSGVDARKGSGPINVAITLHGTTRTPVVPAQIEAAGDQLTVSGRFSIEQTDFGITPYSLLGGAIAVANPIDLRFRILATRVGSQD